MLEDCLRFTVWTGKLDTSAIMSQKTEEQFGQSDMYSKQFPA